MGSGRGPSPWRASWSPRCSRHRTTISSTGVASRFSSMIAVTAMAGTRAIHGSGTNTIRTIIAHGLRSTGRGALWRGVLRTLVDRWASVRGTREMKERNSSLTTAGSGAAADEETADLSGKGSGSRRTEGGAPSCKGDLLSLDRSRMRPASSIHRIRGSHTTRAVGSSGGRGSVRAGTRKRLGRSLALPRSPAPGRGSDGASPSRNRRHPEEARTEASPSRNRRHPEEARTEPRPPEIPHSFR